MGASDVSSNVEAISPYTIGAGGTISVSVFNTFYTNAVYQTTRDDPGWETEELYEAQALLVCHYIARRQGMSGKTSESGIGTYGYSRKAGEGFLTSWMDEYNAMLKRAIDGGSVTATDLLGSSAHGYNHLDYEATKNFALDQQEQNSQNGQVTVDTTDVEEAEDYFYGGA